MTEPGNQEVTEYGIQTEARRHHVNLSDEEARAAKELSYQLLSKRKAFIETWEEFRRNNPSGILRVRIGETRASLDAMASLGNDPNVYIQDFEAQCNLRYRLTEAGFGFKEETEGNFGSNPKTGAMTKQDLLLLNIFTPEFVAKSKEVRSPEDL